MRLVVIVQSITTEESQQRSSLHLLFWDVGQIDACRITLILDIKTEPAFFDR